MNKFLIKNTLKNIKKYSLDNPKEEICGLIYKNNNNYYTYQCKNIAINKKTNFLINPNDIKFCEKKGEVIACYHSHIKNGGFSSEDIYSSLNTQLPYIVYNIIENKFYYFDPIKYSYYKKYINLNYQNAVNDCWSTIARFLKDERNIQTTPPQPNLMLKDENLSWSWEDRKDWIYNINGFKVEPTPKNNRELKINDILILKSKEEKIPTFGALVLENKLMLHQNYHEKSKIESIRKAHIKMISYVGRFKNE